VAGGSEHILLDAYAAKRCPVRVQNAYSPLVPTLKWVPAPEIQARLDAGLAFERKVCGELKALHPTAVTVDPQLAKTDAIAATVAAMTADALRAWCTTRRKGCLGATTFPLDII